MKPEEKARVKIDKQLNEAGWKVVSRQEYVTNEASAVEEALMVGNKESDYLLFIDNKAIAVVEAKKETNMLGEKVEEQAEWYASNPKRWYGLWRDDIVPLAYLANGNKILFKNLLKDDKYTPIPNMHSPKQMLKFIGETSEYGALPYFEKRSLRDCQYNAELTFEQSLKMGNKKGLAVLATGAGKTYLACLASYRLLNYTSTNRVLFLVDRNNLARQTESEFNMFNLTEDHQPMSHLYQINRLRNESDIKGDIVISTIQKLFAYLSGQKLVDGNEDSEDEQENINDETAKDIIQPSKDWKLPKDYFQFIVVDECHRSIYGKWKGVLDYFEDAVVLGLTATPTPEAYSYFNNNVIEKYTYDKSVINGENVPFRVYRIATRTTDNGGIIKKGTEVVELTHKTGEKEKVKIKKDIEFTNEALDRSVVDINQIKTVIKAYKDAIYNDLYPNREKKWEYIPKTLIFAKDDYHATMIVDTVKEVFASDFNGNTPDEFVQKITYSAGDSNALIRDFRTEKEFRIAVTVTLVATGTDVKPLEVVMFMRDVGSDVLYTQMKGRGCRTIKDDKLREVTPNADTKECYYIVDAVGVTEHDKTIPGGGYNPQNKYLSLPDLLEHLAHGEVSDDNLSHLCNYCSTINGRYENHPLFEKHLDYFIENFGFAPRTIAYKIQQALEKESLPPYEGPSDSNFERYDLIAELITNIPARNKLIEMQKGYSITIKGDDKVVYSGFSKETAKEYIENFEKYLNDNKDSIEALRIIYNSEGTLITHNMLVELRDRLLSESKQYGVYQIWKNYKLLDSDGNVDEIDVKRSVNALTNLIQIVRYAYKKNRRLTSLLTGYTQRFTLYCGQNQRVLSDDQVEIMKQVAEYIINDGAIDAQELNDVDADLWKRGVQSFSATTFNDEMQILSKFILRTA